MTIQLDLTKLDTAEMKAARQTKAARLTELKINPRRAALYQRLATASATEIETYINNNVTTLAAARPVLIDMLILLASVLREE